MSERTSIRVRRVRAASVSICAALSVLSACREDAIEPSARLQRPSGLAYVARTSSTAEYPRRADLFIADSEAEGVRVLQLVQTRRLRSEVTVNEDAFILAPALFFPLVIPAEGFPTALAPSRDGKRLYALAPATKQIHVLDIEEVPFNGDPSGPHNIHLGAIDIDGLAGEGATPVAIQRLGVNGDLDFLIVAFDTPGSAGVLAAIVVQRGSDGSFTHVAARNDLIDVGEAPRDLLIRGNDVIASSASAIFAHVVTATASREGPIFGAPSVIDVGEGSSKLIDLPGKGFLALSAIRPVAVFIEDNAGSYTRSMQRFASPYLSDAARDTPETLGRIFLPPSPAVGGAAGRVREPFVDVEGTAVGLFPNIADTSTRTDYLVKIAHLDGRMSLVGGTPLRFAEARSPRVLRLSVDLTPGIEIEECEVDPVICGGDEVPARCDEGVLGFDDVSPRIYRVAYRGDLVSSRTATITALGGGVFELGDRLISSFEDRQVQVGDEMLVQLRVPETCMTGGPLVDLSATGTATAVVDRHRLQFTLTSTTVELRCPELAVARKVEIYPRGEEVVVARVRGTFVDEIAGRFPVTRTGTIAHAELTGALRMHISSPKTMLSCTLAPEGSGGAECYADAECGGGTCAVVAGECAGRCAERCNDGSTTCLAAEIIRRCSAIEMITAPAAVASLSLTEESLASVPDDVVFAPLRRSFFISLPGTRAIAESIIDDTGVFLIRQIR